MNKSISRTAAFAAAPVAAAAMLAASISSPPRANADVEGCVNSYGVQVCGSADGSNIPSVNDVRNVIPNVPVPNINLPNVNVRRR